MRSKSGNSAWAGRMSRYSRSTRCGDWSRSGGWAAGFLYELGVTLEWAEVRLLTRLGGGELRANRPPGRLVLTRGLRRLLDLFAAQAILEAEVQQHGALPPRLAALLGRSSTS